MGKRKRTAGRTMKRDVGGGGGAGEKIGDWSEEGASGGINKEWRERKGAEGRGRKERKFEIQKRWNNCEEGMTWSIAVQLASVFDCIVVRNHSTVLIIYFYSQG